MWVRKRIDIGWANLAGGVVQCCAPTNRKTIRQSIETQWSESGDALACLSVRSGFDLLLRCLALPRGSEVLISAVTIPDMVRIIERHGLVPVPIDLDANDLTPQLESVRGALTSASRAILVAHLFGSRIPLEPLAEFARQNGLLLIEDAAQAYVGPEYTGHAEADVSLFSFGPIKTATALGGALVRVADRKLLDQMRSAQAKYPLQDRGVYLWRLLKYMAMRVGAYRHVFRALVWGYRTLGWDHDRMVNGTVRGFPGESLFRQIRQRPSAPLLAVLRRRLRHFDRRRLAARIERGKLLVDLLAEKVTCPTVEVHPHSYWVFPVVVDNPHRVIDALCEAGFDATQGESMCVVDPPADRPELAAVAAQATIAKTIYVPIYPEMPADCARQMVRVLLEAAGLADSAPAARSDWSAEKSAPPENGRSTSRNRSDKSIAGP